MRPSLLALAATICLATPALGADDPVAGTWSLKARVDGIGFTLTCDFARTGNALTGTCYDGGTRKPHALTRGQVAGDQVSWSYMSSFLGKPFSANYAGKLVGATLTGAVVANGHSGTFTATR
jgi:hypothetical protein